MNKILEQKYDEASTWYEQKYVDGGWENNIYMKDEKDAYDFWQAHGEVGKIISLGVGSGQDIEILGRPDPKTFIGYDISEGMLSNARKKFPEYTFKKHDCKVYIPEKCDIIVSMFGTPNYIGISTILDHYRKMNAKHAFLVLYNENYDDGFGEFYYKYTQKEIETLLTPFKPIIRKLNENYYIIKW